MTFLDFITFVVQSFGTLFTALFLLRMLLQLVRADYYNPISQTIVSATNKPVTVLRRLVPSIGPVDTSSLLMAFITTILTGLVTMLIHQLPITPSAHIAWALVATPLLLVKMLWWILLISVILSWFPAAQQHPLAQIVTQLGFGLTAPLKRIVPNVGMLDITPIVAFILIIGCEALLYNLGANLSVMKIYGWL